MAPTGRILALIGLFQSRPVWTAPELAERLGVTDRTVRRDVLRLRELGYAIGADRGHGGGYRLERGQITPPLLLTDDEAVAVSLALRTAGSTGLAGDQEDSLRALLKLENSLPAPARTRMTRLASALRVGEPPPASTVPVDLLTTLAEAIATQVQTRLSYLDRRGAQTRRRVNPYRLVAWNRRWYLSAFDLDRDDWRTFRLDRIQEVHATTFRYRPRPDEPDITATLGSHHDPATYPHRMELVIEAPVTDLEGYAPYATLEQIDATSTRMISGAEDAARAATWLLRLEHPFRLVGDEAVREEVQRMRDRLDRSLRADGRF